MLFMAPTVCTWIADLRLPSGNKIEEEIFCVAKTHEAFIKPEGIIQNCSMLVVVAHTSNPSTQRTEAGGLKA